MPMHKARKSEWQSGMCIQQTVAALSASWRWGVEQVVQICVGEQVNSTQALEGCQDVASLVHCRIFLKDCVPWNQLVVSTLEELAVWLESPCNVSEELVWTVCSWKESSSFPNSVPIAEAVDLIRVLPLLRNVSQASKVISHFWSKMHVGSVKILNLSKSSQNHMQ